MGHERTKSELRSLTALRGLAAMAVVTQHFSATAQGFSSGWIPSIVPHGYMAVDFFYVLSGFIMGYTYLAAFNQDGMRAYVPFLMKRVARIVPLSWAILALILVLGAIADIWGQSGLFIDRNAVRLGFDTSVLVNVLHLQGLMPLRNLNDPSWSVSMEMIAYLFFPVFIAAINKGPRWLAVAWCLAGAGVLTGVAATQHRLGLGLRYAPLDLLRCFIEFGFGLLAFRIYASRRWFATIGEDRWTWAVSAAVVSALVLRIDLLAALLFPWAVLAWARNRGAASQWMGSGIPYFLGVISYSIYMVHNLFRRPELALVAHWHPAPLSPPAALLFAVVGSLSILPAAALAYYLIERPGRNWARHLLTRQPKFVPTKARS